MTHGERTPVPAWAPARRVILTTIRYYLPGDLSGGPVRSLSNLVGALGDEYDFRILTNDRDEKDPVPYPGVSVDAWNQVGKASVYYVSPGVGMLWRIWRVLSNTPHDTLYLNSFFHPLFTLWPLWMQWLKWCPRTPVIVAPRGELSPGALRLGQRQKALYRWVTHALGLYDHVTWHASNIHEESEIRAALGAYPRTGDAPIAIASDIPTSSQLARPAHDSGTRTHGDPLRVVFISRITPKKNLDFALKVLASVQTPVEFNIYGPLNDSRYWQRCLALVAALPPHVVARYKGAIAHAAVADVLGSHDLLFLPTLGENYGHVIIESMMAGTPVLISDATPWRGLADAGVGWDLPLHEEQAFAGRIQDMWSMTADAGGLVRARVRRYGEQHAASPAAIVDHRALFGASPCAG